jgi:hypothetical protein
VNIDPRTGRLNLRDTGNLATAKRGPRFLKVSDQLNENPAMLFNVLHTLRLAMITELVEHKANYLGLQFYRTRNFTREGKLLHLVFLVGFHLCLVQNSPSLDPLPGGQCTSNF